ncbi:MAG: hypothetical protein E6H88_08795 [Chloroflexi bacterium]|nr:MAG: hypothetical protein E6H88_08795 [Chloroflexota bacterium]
MAERPRAPSRLGRWLLLAPVALLVAAACSQPSTEYTGVQPRTAVDKIPSGGQMKNFTLVGSNPLIDPKLNLPRGMNGGITAIRDCLYVGSNIDLQPTLILDMKDMSKPTIVGEVPGIKGKGMGIEAIEAVGDLNLLVNSVRAPFGIGKWKPIVSAEDKNVGLVVYDATDCQKPQIVSKINIPQNDFLHYMTLWRDPNKADRVFASVTFNSGVPEDGVDIRVYDLTGCPKSCNPKLAGEWGLRAQLGVPANVTTKYEGGTRVDNTQTHDVTWSLDGKRMHLAQTKYGYLQIDSSAIAEGRSCDVSPAKSKNEAGHCLSVFPDFKPLAAFGTEVANVHGVVKIPGRPYVALQHEGHACPFGGITFAYIGTDGFSTYDRATGQLVAPGGAGSVGSFRGDLFPRNAGTFALPEQNPDRCPKQGDQIPPTTAATGIYGTDIMRSSKTVHNALALPSVLFATWYGGGLRAVDITNPQSPFELGFFFNRPAPEVKWCAEGAAGPCADPEVDAEGVPVRTKQLLPPDVFARSYPIAMNGHIVYSDENMGVYVLKYTGPHANEIPAKGLCISHNPSVTAPGYEPCAPYR